MSILATGGAAQAGLNVLGQILSKAQAVNKADSYISYTQPARVEPIMLVDVDCLFSDMLPDTVQSLTSIFAGYYLQAFTLSTTVGSVSVVKHLDKLNPNRDPVIALGLESADYTHKLPTISMEADDDIVGANTRDAVKEVKELTNLSVGKLLNVEIVDGENKVTIPISIRLMANSIPSDNLVHILSAGNKDTSFKERWHGWRSGRLELVRDLILCQDLIDAHTKTLVNDKSGIYANILSRRSKNAAAAVLGGEISIASASNLAIISSDSARKLETEVMGQLSNFKTRQKIFEETYMMILVVIDKEWDVATFYHRGIPEATTASLRDLKSANKSGGTDVMSILSAFREGKSVAL